MRPGAFASRLGHDTLERGIGQASTCERAYPSPVVSSVV